MNGPADLPTEPGALDAWLVRREAECPDLRPDAEARIAWAEGARQRRPLALVYLHGFSASPMETAPLGERLAASLQANVFYARLTGHGRSGAAMGEATTADWLADAALALAIGERIGERVVLVGTSTGGTLATLLAAREPQAALAAVILIAPNFGLRDPRSALLGWPGAGCWVPRLFGAQRTVAAENEAHARYWTLNYPTRSLVQMMGLVRQVWQANVATIRVPVLALYCERDRVVSTRRTRAMLARMSQVEVETYPARGDGSQHVVIGDAFGPHNTDAAVRRCLQFLTAHGVAPG